MLRVSFGVFLLFAQALVSAFAIETFAMSKELTYDEQVQLNHKAAVAIIGMILSGFSARVPVRVEHDRETAIRIAVESAVEGDVVLVAGKGHEDTQTYGATVRRFSDREVAQSLARKAA